MADQRREQMLQAALDGPQVTRPAFELSMKYASGQLGFPWSRRRGRN
jgi:hypothetical protein